MTPPCGRQKSGSDSDGRCEIDSDVGVKGRQPTTSGEEERGEGQEEKRESNDRDRFDDGGISGGGGSASGSGSGGCRISTTALPRRRKGMKIVKGAGKSRARRGGDGGVVRGVGPMHVSGRPRKHLMEADMVTVAEGQERLGDGRQERDRDASSNCRASKKRQRKRGTPGEAWEAMWARGFSDEEEVRVQLLKAARSFTDLKIRGG